MKISTASLFVMYELTPEEQISGCILSQEQEAVIQNDIALAAHGQASLRYDPLNPVEFAQKQASLAGTIVALRSLLDRSAAKKAELSDIAAMQAASYEQNPLDQDSYTTTTGNVQDTINELFPKNQSL